MGSAGLNFTRSSLAELYPLLVPVSALSTILVYGNHWPQLLPQLCFWNGIMQVHCGSCMCAVILENWMPTSLQWQDLLLRGISLSSRKRVSSLECWNPILYCCTSLSKCVLFF